ncbi:MAG: hypothetical protein H7333_03545, partial [Bdellovibrionales bacterium]|nr:hypothetical protein [Oligoflexia bacterium]
MKTQFLILSLMIFTMGAQAFASRTQSEAREIYERVSDARELSEWTCNAPGNQSVVLFHTGVCSLKDYAYTRVITIRNPNVCRALDVVC